MTICRAWSTSRPLLRDGVDPNSVTKRARTQRADELSPDCHKFGK